MGEVNKFRVWKLRFDRNIFYRNNWNNLSISSKLLNKKHIAMTIERLNSDDRSIAGLISKVKEVLPEEKSALITQGVLVNLLSNVWYGAGGSESVLMGLEHVPSWIALMYSATVDKTYKRSRLASILEMSARKLDVNEIDKFITNYIKSKTI